MRRAVSAIIVCSGVSVKSMPLPLWTRAQQSERLFELRDDPIEECGRAHPVEDAMIAGEHEPELAPQLRRAVAIRPEHLAHAADAENGRVAGIDDRRQIRDAVHADIGD